jgi:hypothetical protein
MLLSEKKKLDDLPGAAARRSSRMDDNLDDNLNDLRRQLDTVDGGRPT